MNQVLILKIFSKKITVLHKCKWKKITVLHRCKWKKGEVNLITGVMNKIIVCFFAFIYYNLLIDESNYFKKQYEEQKRKTDNEKENKYSDNIM